MGTNDTPDKHEIARDKKGLFLPGQSANPNGRPKRKTLTELIHAKLDDTPQAWEAIVALVVHKILKDGDKDILKVFWEYTDGKPKQSIELEDKTQTIKDMKDYVTKQIQSLDRDIPQGSFGTTVSNDTKPDKNL